jgi:signal transduction histidine kinase
MMKSIRVQLPLTYAAIALLAALALGALMLLRLNDYYSQIELDTMGQGAQEIQSALQSFDLAALPEAELQAYVDSFAFMVRSRVRVYAANGALLADSGEFDPQSTIRFATLPLTATSQGDVVFFQNGDTTGQVVVGTGGTSGAGVSLTQTTPQPAPMGVAAPAPFITYQMASEQLVTLPVFSSVMAVSSVGVEEETGARSNHSVELPLGQKTKLVVSGGPAFGRQIVSSVAQAWALAGLIAVALAAGIGWLASRRITQPVMALAEATDRMASGDMSARVGALGGLEFGALGHTFNDMAGRVETTIHTLRRFAADAAHELKTPLTALHTDLELAEGESDPARLSGLLARAREQVSELERLTSGLLDLSRLETGALALEKERFDLCTLARQLSERYAARAEQAEQEFILEVGEEPVFILGNPGRLELALSNLLENALKFTPNGGTVRLRLEQNGTRANLIVEDSGIGVPEQDLALIFERFHRGRNASGYPGSGLGLAIVRAVAEAHGGAAYVENLPGGGARFRIELPLM